jgi:hypothetical protein
MTERRPLASPPSDREPSSRRWSPEMITATAAVVIGVSALFVSLYETSLVRQHQRASVWPYLEAGHSWDGQRFRVLAANTGIGPVRVEQVFLRMGEEYLVDWGALVAQAEPRPGVGWMTSQFSGRVLLPGDPIDLLVVEDVELAERLNDLVDEVRLEVCYCSIFDECWETDFREVRRPVRSCALNPGPAFRQ